MLTAADGIGREAIESSNLASIGYAEDRQVCAVEFRSGLILHYSGISLEMFTEFYCAQSLGQFYNRRIKGKFPAETMTGPCKACGANGIVDTLCTDCGCDKHYRVERRPEPDHIDELLR